MARKSKRPAARSRSKRSNAKGKRDSEHRPSPKLQKTQVPELTDVLDVDQAGEISGDEELVVEKEPELGDAAEADSHGEGRPPHD
jgi:hypothetical protein